MVERNEINEVENGERKPRKKNFVKRVCGKVTHVGKKVWKGTKKYGPTVLMVAGAGYLGYETGKKSGMRNVTTTYNIGVDEGEFESVATEIVDGISSMGIDILNDVTE